MEMSELQVDQVVKTMKTWLAKYAGPDGWGPIGMETDDTRDGETDEI